MTTFPPISPNLRKGNLVAIDQATQQRTVIEFQYNPDTLTRRLTAQMASGNYDRKEAFRLKGPPDEVISLEIEIDATDQLEAGDRNTLSSGIQAKLAVLELLLYPKSQTVIDNENLARQGTIEVIPMEAPLVLFVWDQRRSLPVQLTSFSITEEAFDIKLNPTRAKVSLELTVLNYMHLGLSSQGGGIFMAYHKQKEQIVQEQPPKTPSGSV